MLNGKALMGGWWGELLAQIVPKSSQQLYISAVVASTFLFNLNQFTSLLLNPETPLPKLWDGNATGFLAIIIMNNVFFSYYFSCFTMKNFFTELNEKFLKIFIRSLNNVSKKTDPSSNSPNLDSIVESHFIIAKG